MDQTNKTLKILMLKHKKLRKAPSELIISVDDGSKTMPKLIEKLRNNRIEITSINLKKPTLDDVFIQFTGRHLKEEQEKNNQHYLGKKN